MAMVKDGVMDGQLQRGIPGEAANEAVIEGAGRPAGWDPFEVWRTRVRDVADQRAQPKPAPAKD